MEKILINAFADEASSIIDNQIVAMKRNNLNGLEIRNADGISCVSLNAAQAREIRRKLDDAGLQVWSMGSPIGKITLEDDFDQHLDLLRNGLEIANVLGAKNLRMFSFFMPQGEDPAAHRNEVIDKVGRMLEVAQGSGVLMCHENEKGIYGDMANRCLELLTTFPQMGGIFDSANFVQCGQDTWEAWQMLKPFIKYMHVKDALADGKVVPAGRGIGNLARIVSEYLAMGGHAFTIEPHLSVFDGLSGLEREGQTSDVGTQYTYPTTDAAFDAACQAFQQLLGEAQA
ncbi:MAG: TIM barrel protein [Clostridia bacterium]|nr:TIM barrel protein [Clostridia bacterium]